MKQTILAVFAGLIALSATGVFAKGGGGGHSSGSHSTGGSSHSSKSSGSSGSKTVHVHGCTRKDGKYVAPYDRAAPGHKSVGGYTSGGTSIVADHVPVRTSPPAGPRTTARTTLVSDRPMPKPDDDGSPMLAEAPDDSAGTDDPLAMERAARLRAEAEAEKLRKELARQRFEKSQKEADDNRNRAAESKFQLAKGLWDQDKKVAARKHFNEVIEGYAETPAAEKARKFLVK